MVKAVPKKLTIHTRAALSHCCQPLRLSAKTHSTNTSVSPTICTVILGQACSISSTTLRVLSTNLLQESLEKRCTFRDFSFALMVLSAQRRAAISVRKTSGDATSAFLLHFR